MKKEEENQPNMTRLMVTLCQNQLFELVASFVFGIFQYGNFPSLSFIHNILN